MNLYEIIKSELEEKSDNWFILDNLNYIYLRTLQLLSHDSRAKYSNKPNIIEELFEKELNIFNIEDKRVVCSSWSKVYTYLVNCLLSEEEDFDVSFTEGTPEPHMYSRVFLTDGSTIDYDPLSKTNDFVRAKKQLPLNGIRINNNKPKSSNEIDIEFSLEKIGYRVDKIRFLKNLKHLITKGNLTSKEVLEALLKDIDYTYLDLIEFNTYLNMQFKKYSGLPLEALGIRFKNNGENSLIINSNGEDLYQEDEINQRVIIRKI